MSLFGKQNQEETPEDGVIDAGKESLDVEEESMTLIGVGGGSLDDAELLAVDQQASGGIWANNATVVVMVILVGGLGIFGMRYMMKDNTAGLVDHEVVTRIENFIALNRNGGISQADAKTPAEDEDGLSVEATIRLMTEPWREQQVRREDLAKNPFVVGLKKPEMVDGSELKLEQERQRLAKVLSGWRLDGVMGGKNPIAVVDGELYQHGAVIGEFKVSSIDADSVYLSHDMFPEDMFQLVVESDEKRRR